MNNERFRLVNYGNRLPNFSLPDSSRKHRQPLFAPGASVTVAVLTHALGCLACRAYLDALAANCQSLVEWGGRVVVVQPEPPDPPEDAERSGKLEPTAFLVLVDSDARAASAAKVEPPAILIADEWGELHVLHEAGAQHRFLPPNEVEESVRYLVTQCPECQGEAL